MRIMRTTSAWLFVLMTIAAAASDSRPFRCIMYLTGQHDIVPPKGTLKEVSHVILAFMRSEFFNVDKKPDEYPLFTSVSDIRGRFSNHTKLMVAIGGWGDTRGFEEAAGTEFSRQRWARQVAAMVAATEADGIDVDWEYPGGNRDDYREIPNSDREWEIEAYVSLLQELRTALGPEKILSAAVPGKENDLIAFTPDTIPKIMNEVDFLNVMTYDLMNRRNNLTTHHSGVQNSKDAIQRYINLGASPEHLNLGFGYYVKWFMTQQCDPEQPIGCPTQLLEDPKTGADLSKTGGFSWHDKIPEDVSISFSRAQSDGKYDTDGSYYYWDADERRWWTFDTKKSIQTKFDRVVPELEVGGVFAWGIGEDAPDFEHFQTTTHEVRKIRAGIGSKDEL
ncbi:glycoside hydrolase superfamily [Fusarium tricinctum]|uniref:chitinase n=2 Tax=Fusarium tricinctum species complex TaxID=679429 RepID=A0A8K0RZ92_9HYPO|nr:glycoside hydrolase superfamily [Fusarium tricinctum]